MNLFLNELRVDWSSVLRILTRPVAVNGLDVSGLKGRVISNRSTRVKSVRSLAIATGVEVYKIQSTEVNAGRSLPIQTAVE